jgi:hypothetical protein
MCSRLTSFLTYSLFPLIILACFPCIGVFLCLKWREEKMVQTIGMSPRPGKIRERVDWVGLKRIWTDGIVRGVSMTLHFFVHIFC